MRRRSQQHHRILIVLLALWLPGVGCSIKKLAVNRIGDALSESGSTFASDDDPELIEAALPFSLKLMESLLAESPRHEGLLGALTSGFTQYAYAFVQQKADELEDHDLDAATAQWDRARRLYLRARDYGLRGLNLSHENFVEALRTDPLSAVAAAEVEDVPLLYWTAASWSAAIAVSKDDPDLVGDLPVAEAMIDRALELNESFEDGAIHGFLITYEMSRAGGVGDPAMRARKHFERAVELSGGQLASPLVALAESVALAEQNRAEFEDLLQRALAIDPDAKTEWRMDNLVYQRRARWLLERADRLILD